MSTTAPRQIGSSFAILDTAQVVSYVSAPESRLDEIATPEVVFYKEESMTNIISRIRRDAIVDGPGSP